MVVHMGKIALTLLFDGGAFHGWQVQQNAYTVQSAVQDALESVLGFRPDVTGCSRTDSGVHANEYVCHIDDAGVTLPISAFIPALNTAFMRGRRTSGKIAVKEAVPKQDDFHARYSCLAKEYIYKIWNARYSNPFLNGLALYYPKKINLAELAFLGEEFRGEHDFSAFMSKGSKITEDTVRTVYDFTVTREGDLVTLAVTADGFLYNMVRIMTGTFLAAAAGNLRKGELTKIIKSKDRSLAGDTAPAHGLYLNRVFYEGMPT